MNQAGVSLLRDLTGIYGDAVVATLVLVVGVLFWRLERAHNARLNDVRKFGEASIELISVIRANTSTVQAAVAKLDEASDTLRLAFELMGRKRRRGEPPPSTGEAST